MVQKKSYRSVAKQNKSDIKRLTASQQVWQEKIMKQQELIDKSVLVKKTLQKKLRTGMYRNELHKQQMQARVSRINELNRKRGKTIHNHFDRIDKLVKNIKIKRQKIRAPRISSLKATTKNGYFMRHSVFPLLHVNEQSIPELIQLVHEKYRRALEKLGNRRSKHSLLIDDNTIKHIRLVFSDEYGDHISSTNVNSLDELEQAFINEMNKHNPGTGDGATNNATKKTKTGDDDEDDTTWYERYLMAIDFFIYNPARKVGCSKKQKPAVVFPLSPNELIRLYSPKASSNRCFDMCLIKGKEHKTNEYCKRRAYKIRLAHDISISKKLDPKGKEANIIADELGVSYRVYHGIVKGDRLTGDSIEKSFKLYCKYGTQDENTIDLLKIAGHCYLIKDKHIYNIKCSKCGDVRKRGIEKDHKCSADRQSFYQKKVMHKQIMEVRKLRKDIKKNWVIFDLETLPCGKGQTHRVYAVGWYDMKKEKYHASYGKNAMKIFMRWVLDNNDKTYIAYNGCRFDFYFLQKMLLNNHITPNFLMNSGRILSMKWGGFEVKSKTTGKMIKVKQNQVWDLCNFMPGFSLRSACEAFDTTMQKQEFDHTLMKDWNCVAKHKKDVLHYLKYDVLSLKELTEKYVATCEELYDASPTKYLTLSSYSEKVWSAGLDSDDIIEIPDMEKQDYIGKSVFGGRTYPCKKKYESKFYKTIHSNKSNKSKLKTLYKQVKKDGDFIFNGDINSQYPACMAGCGLMSTIFPTGTSEWIINDSKKCEKIFNDNKQLGIYEIEFTCPNKKLRHPILPRKKVVERKNGKKVFLGVEWSLLDGKGVYNTVDIQNAMKHGYKIKFLGRALVWEGISDQIFHTYIHTVYNHKVNATKEGNKVKRQIAKLMMNSLYGKTLQRPVAKAECIARDTDTIEEFMSEHKITDWDIVENSDTEVDYVILTGEKLDQESIGKKPRHLGSFVLGYSRRLWLMFLEAIDPTVQDEITSYLDTDSLRIRGKHYEILKKKGMIDNEKLGYLSNDCKNEALIIKEINLAPKCYLYECLDKDGNLKVVKKSKGIINKYLENEMYDNAINKKSKTIYCSICNKHHSNTIVHWTGMKKVNKRITKADREQGVGHWSIKNQEYTRTFYKNDWSGMKCENDTFLPFGYTSENKCLL